MKEALNSSRTWSVDFTAFGGEFCLSMTLIKMSDYSEG